MDFKTCYSCAGALFSARKTIAFERVCCSVPFHGNCIQDAHMEFCPSCGAFTDSIDSAFLWNPTEYQPSRPADIVVIEDSDDEGPSRPRRNATTTCAICLEDGSLSDKLLETSCCSQRAHVSCLRRHYDIPGRCRTEEERETIERNLGLPNCFVCRMDERGLRPLSANVLAAILPIVEGASSSAHDANLHLITFRGIIGRTIHKWLEPWKFMLAVNRGSVGVKYVDGTEETRQIPPTFPVSVDRARASIIEAIGRMLPEWAGLSVDATEFTASTCRNFRLSKVSEIVVSLNLTNFFKGCKKSSRANARPYDLEYFNTELSSWHCYAHFFDFRDNGDPQMTARTSYCHYKSM